ncbi:aldo/keto reductase [Singulisphaera sp. Ch08]|uniref:Aldo/keto reductase n=1 Tax=Singulisphaera sp. Ch08 TaxID=3120278 RepID=A0AAU7CAH8_9BACT
MSDDQTNSPDRREFLQAGALATAAALGAATGLQAQNEAAKPTTLPKRKLGKTGVEITLLEMGTGALRERGVLDRLLRLAYASGVRTFDTANLYGTEPGFKKWFEQAPEVRKDVVLVTKDEVDTPKQMLKMLDQRLEALGTDYVDFYFVHGLGDHHTLDESINFVKGQEFKETAEAIRKSGKAKFVGFSTHHKDRAQTIQAAAEGGIVDAIMLMYTPWLDKDSPLNKALDTCYSKGVGLISMKQVAGQFPAKPKFNVLEEVVRRAPMLAERKLSPYQGLLHAIWTDERISGSCVSIKTTEQLREDADAARRYEPLKTTEIEQLRDAALAFGPTLCADCDGRCSVAAGTKAELGDLTRFLTYHEHHGIRVEARRQYAALSPEARDWAGADLEAARAACPNKLNFAKLLPDADRYLA